LVLDDEINIVVIFKRSLKLGGFSVFGFTDPLLALEHFRDNSDRYGIILTDFRMPQMNGIEFATRIRALTSTTAVVVKILIMSAFDMRDLEIPTSLQIAGLLQKPLSPIQLQNAILKYM